MADQLTSSMDDSIMDNIVEGLRESTWIDWGWEWAKTAITKTAEPFLTGALVWSSAKMTDPTFTALHPTVDSIFTNGALLALDGAAIGLLKLAASSQDEETAKKMKNVAKWCFGLMILNFSFSGIAAYFKWPESSYGWLIVLLIIARGLLTVNYILIMSENRKHNKTEKKLKKSLAQQLKSEIQSEIQSVRSEVEHAAELKLQTEVKLVRSEIEKRPTPDVSKLKSEIETAAQLKLQTEIRMIRSESESEKAGLKREIEELKEQKETEIEELKLSLIDEIELHYRKMQSSQVNGPDTETELQAIEQKAASRKRSDHTSKMKKSDLAQEYVLQQRNEGREPGIEEIKAAAQCSDGTASAAKQNKYVITEEIETGELLPV